MIRLSHFLAQIALLLATLVIGSARAEIARSRPTVEPLAEGGAIKTSAGAGKLFSPLPGVAVTAEKATTASLVRAEITKSGDVVLSRHVELKLEQGTLSHSIDKRIAGKTSFEVRTPLGRRSVQGLVGSVTVEGSCVKIASLTGTMTFSALGVASPIPVKAGSFLAVCGEDNAKIRVINAVAKTWTDYAADGTALATRAATATELESTRGFFAAALAHASAAEGAGLLGPASVAEITQTLTKINQSFASEGLAQFDGASLGGGSPGSRSPGTAFAPPTGSAGSSLNPANTLRVTDTPANPVNTSGEVNSPER